MADWRDGSEFAPVERPIGFAAPRTEDLSAPVDEPHLADDRPAEAPTTYQAPQAAGLETLIPHAGDPRNPMEPFDTAGSGFVGNTAWGAMTSSPELPWDPRRPLVVNDTNGFTATQDPSSSASFAPPTGNPVVPIAPAPSYPSGSAYPAPASTVPGYPTSATYPAPPSTVPWQDASQPQTPLMKLLVIALTAASIVIPMPTLWLLIASIAGRYLRPRNAPTTRVLNIGFWVVLILGVLISGSDPYGDTYTTWSTLRTGVCVVTTVLTGYWLYRPTPRH